MEKSIYSKEYSLFLEHLRSTREERGLTQSDMAQKLGQTQSFVSKVERGERRLDVVELREFCRALGVGLSRFVGSLEKALENDERQN